MNEEKSKYSKCNTLSYEEIKNIYIQVVDGKLKSFPRTLCNDETLTEEVAGKLARYFFEEVLGYKTREEVVKNISMRKLTTNKLSILARRIKSIDKLIEVTFPEYNIKKWELKQSGKYDKEEDRLERIKVFFNDLKRDKIIDDDIDIIYRKDIYLLIQKYNLNGLMGSKYNGSSTKLLMWYFNKNTEYMIYEWDFFQPPRNFWTKENSSRAFKQVLWEDGYFELDESQKRYFLRNLDKKYFYDNNIYGVFHKFKNIYEIVTYTFGEVLFEWEYKVVHKLWNNREKRNVAMKQLIEERLKLKNEDIPKFIKHTVLQNTQYYKFSMPCIKYYNGMYFDWINEIYPNQFKKVTLKVI